MVEYLEITGLKPWIRDGRKRGKDDTQQDRCISEEGVFRVWLDFPLSLDFDFTRDGFRPKKFDPSWDR